MFTNHTKNYKVNYNINISYLHILNLILTTTRTVQHTSTYLQMPKCEQHEWMANEAEEAVNASCRGMSIRCAANFYGIPKSTTCDKLNGWTPMG